MSNADIGKTLAHVLGLKITAKGKLQGRIIAEALPGGAAPKVTSGTLRGPVAADPGGLPPEAPRLAEPG